jgi:hypothetical protein
MRVNATAIAPIRFMTIDLCRHSRRARRAIASSPRRKLMKTEAVWWRTGCWSWAPPGGGQDRGDDREGTTARRLVNDGGGRLLLGLFEVGVGAGGVVGDVDDAVDLGDSLGDRHFDALAEGDCGHAAALASPAEA